MTGPFDHDESTMRGVVIEELDGVHTFSSSLRSFQEGTLWTADMEPEFLLGFPEKLTEALHLGWRRNNIKMERLRDTLLDERSVDALMAEWLSHEKYVWGVNFDLAEIGQKINSTRKQHAASASAMSATLRQMLLNAASHKPDDPNSAGLLSISRLRIVKVVARVQLDIYATLWWHLRELYRTVAVVHDEFQATDSTQKANFERYALDSLAVGVVELVRFAQLLERREKSASPGAEIKPDTTIFLPAGVGIVAAQEMGQ